MLAAASGVFAIVVALLAARQFATAPWPLSGGHPGSLVTAGLLLLAQALKAFGWARMFAPEERPTALALAAGNGGAALIGVVLPGRFDDAMRIAIRRGARGLLRRGRPALRRRLPDRPAAATDQERCLTGRAGGIALRRTAARRRGNCDRSGLGAHRQDRARPSE